MTLEQELRALRVDFPPEPDLAPEVRARLERRRRPWLVPALAVVATVAALLAIPQTRAAILRFLDVGGVRIERVETQPAAPQTQPRLGEPATEADARAAVEFELALPERPLRLYVDRTVPGGMVNATFDGLVLSQWRGEQLPFVQKQLGPDSRLEPTEVDGAPAVWIEGGEHAIVYSTPRRQEAQSKERRLAGNVLIWERAGITYRLEGAKTLEQALAVARDL